MASGLSLGARKKASPKDPYVHHGRHFGRTVFAFPNIHALVANALAFNDENPPNTPQERREARIYVKLLNLIPGLKEIILDADPDEVTEVCASIQKGTNGGRADDTKGLKPAIIDWISPEDGEPLRPKLPRNSKIERGFHHPRTGFLLCPISMDWADEEVREQLRNKEISVSGEDWPVFLFRDEKFDSEEPWRGLLRSRLLVLAYKHVFTSPSSADDHSRATRSGNARLHGMTRVTAASIAYIATQVRFALSDAAQFCRSDYDTDSETFYTSLLDLLEDPEEEEEVTALIAWWNKVIFPSTLRSTTRVAPANSAWRLIKKKRAEKKALAGAASTARGEEGS